MTYPHTHRISLSITFEAYASLDVKQTPTHRFGISLRLRFALPQLTSLRLPPEARLKRIDMRLNIVSKLVKSRKSEASSEPTVHNQQNPSNVPKARTQHQKITARELRELRDLIRYRYKLDVQIWGRRDVKPHSRYLIEVDMRKSDAALASIRRKVEEWDSRAYFASDAEYRKFGEIKTRLCAPGKRNWMEHPPWEQSEVNGQSGMQYPPWEIAG